MSHRDYHHHGGPQPYYRDDRAPPPPYRDEPPRGFAPPPPQPPPPPFREEQLAADSPRVDRERTCPFLVPCFVRKGAHSQPRDYHGLDGVPSDADVTEVHIYTWEDATLLELAELIRERIEDVRTKRVFREDRGSGAGAKRFPDQHFCMVYPDREGACAVASGNAPGLASRPSPASSLSFPFYPLCRLLCDQGVRLGEGRRQQEGAGGEKDAGQRGLPARRLPRRAFRRVKKNKLERLFSKSITTTTPAQRGRRRPQTVEKGARVPSRSHAHSMPTTRAATMRAPDNWRPSPPRCRSSAAAMSALTACTSLSTRV